MAWFMGIDIGAGTSKGVITKDGKLLAYHLLPSGVNYRAVAQKLRKELVAKIEKELQDVPEVRLAHVYPNTKPNYWLYPVWGPPSLGSQGEINYIEAEYQRMQKLRRTSVGVPLPDYVQYVPGSCPKAEESTRGASGFFVHHSVEDEELDRAIAGFKKRISTLKSEQT